jgi:hypothetical protein
MVPFHVDTLHGISICRLAGSRGVLSDYDPGSRVIWQFQRRFILISHDVVKLRLRKGDLPTMSLY